MTWLDRSPGVVNVRAYARHARPHHARAAGTYVLPDDVVFVGRPSPWGNPYRIDSRAAAPLTHRDRRDRDEVIRLFRTFAIDRLEREPAWLEPLRGKRLACYCAPLACHADVLLELANR